MKKIYLVFVFLFVIISGIFAQWANDYCESATFISSLDGVFGTTLASYQPFVSSTDPTDEDNTPLGTVFCGSIENNSWFEFEAMDNIMQLDVVVTNCSDGNGIQMEIYVTDDCYNFSSVSNCENTGVQTDFSMNADNLIPGTLYLLMVDGQAGDICDYNISTIYGAINVNAGDDVNICLGQGTQLNASGGSNYQWFPAEGLDNPFVSNPWAQPYITTTYIVWASSTNADSPPYCDTVTVYVDDCFCGASAGPDDNVCALEYDLCANVLPGDYNGFWSSFSSGVTFENILNPLSNVSVLFPGNYYFTWTVTNSLDSTCSDLVLIEFDTVPTSSFIYYGINCLGDTCNIIYTGNASETATYFWDFDGGEIISGTGQGPYQILWTESGNHFVSLEVITSTDTSIHTTVVIMTPESIAISINTGAIYCANDTVVGFSIDVLGGSGEMSFEWSNISGPPFYAGNYAVTVSDYYGCSISDNFEIIDPEEIILNLSSTPENPLGASNGTATVNVSGGVPAYFYYWSNESINETITGLTTGWYTVLVEDSNGCGVSDSVFVDFTISSEVIRETSEYKIYPIPTKNNLYVDVLNSEICLIEICDVLGKKLFVKPLIQGIQVFNLSGMGRGLYFVFLSSKQMTVMEKVVLD